MASPSKHNTSIDSRLDSNKLDEEHRLIARYAARLAADMNNAARSPSEMALNTQEATRQQRELIIQLEAKNREIMREIQRLKKEQELAANEQSVSGHNPTLMAELRLLRQRKDELEMRMGALQESRRDLMVQLEGLMKMLKNQGSPRSTPNSSPKSGMSGKSPPLGVPRSTPSTPGDPLAGVGGDVKLAFDQSSRVRNLRNDLLVAADSVTNAMTSLVRELNSEASGSDSDEECERQIEKIKGFEFTESSDQTSDWHNSRGQESNFLNQLRTRRLNQPNRSGSDSEAYANTDDGDSYVRTDDDSYVATSDGEYRRTDDEYANAEHDDIVRRFEKIRQNHDIYRHHNSERSNARDHDSAAPYNKTDEHHGDNVEWEDSTKRWVNR